MNLSSACGSRKSLAVLSIICILLACFVGVLPVSASGRATLTASAVETEKGDTVDVAFRLEENTGIWGLKFKVGYDHSVLTLTSVKNGSIFSDEEITLPESLDKEQFVFLACSSQLKNINKNGTVATLKFTVAKDAELKSYPITVSVTQAINASGKNIKMNAKDGNVTVIHPVYNGEEGNGVSNTGEEGDRVSDTDDERKGTEKDTEKDTESPESVKDKETGATRTEEGKFKIKALLITLAVIAVVCATGALLILILKKRGKKQCKRKRRSKK